jgi:hypothetical protein
VKDLNETRTLVQSEHQVNVLGKPVLIERASDDEYEGRLRVRGIYQKVGAQNENGRVYPSSVWETVLKEGSRFMGRLREGRVLGELEHPESGNTHLARVSHKILKVWRESLDAGNEYEVPAGDYILGEEIVLNTPNGRILEELYRAHVPVGISSRGRGDTRPKGEVEEVLDNYELDTFDHVYQPSVVEATPRPVSEAILNEQPPPPVAGGSGGAPVPPSAKPPPQATSPVGPSGKVAKPPSGPSGKVDLPSPEDGPDGPAGPPKKPSGGPAPAELVSKSEDLVQKMQDLMMSDDAQELIEVWAEVMGVVRDLARCDSEECDTYQEVLLALAQAVAKRLLSVEGMTPKSGKSSKNKKSSPKKKPDFGGGGEDKEDEESEEGEENKAEESLKHVRRVLAEADMENVADQIDKDDKIKKQKELSRSDIEGMLTTQGHDADETNVAALSGALKAKGYRVRTERSFTVDEATAVDVATQAVERATKLEQELKARKDFVPRSKVTEMKQLQDALVRRAKRYVKERDALALRLEAAIKSIHGLVQHVKKMEVSEHIREKLAENPDLEKVTDFLKESKTVNEVEKKIGQLSEAVSAKPPKRSSSDLPPITEDSAQRAGQDEELTESLVDKNDLASVMARRLGEN